MDKNVKLNRVASKAHVFNMDGREFVRLLLATPGGPAHRVDELQAAGPGTSGWSVPQCVWHWFRFGARALRAC